MTIRCKLAIPAFLALVLVGASFASGDPSHAAQAAQSPGIKVGAKVPVAMPLRDSKGAATKLADHMGRKGMILILTRSASWCPYCKAQMIGLKAIQASVEQRGYSLATLSYDDPAILAAFQAERGTNYVLFSDTGSKMINALGLADPAYGPDSRAHGVPQPTILVIGRNGAVRAKDVSLNYKVRPTNETILAMIDASKA